MSETEHAWKHVLNEALEALSSERDIVPADDAGEAVEAPTGPVTVTWPTMDEHGVSVDTYEMHADTIDGQTVYSGFRDN